MVANCLAAARSLVWFQFIEFIHLIQLDFSYLVPFTDTDCLSAARKKESLIQLNLIIWIGLIVFDIKMHLAWRGTSGNKSFKLYWTCKSWCPPKIKISLCKFSLKVLAATQQSDFLWILWSSYRWLSWSWTLDRKGGHRSQKGKIPF